MVFNGSNNNNDDDDNQNCNLFVFYFCFYCDKVWSNRVRYSEEEHLNETKKTLKKTFAAALYGRWKALAATAIEH